MYVCTYTCTRYMCARAMLMTRYSEFLLTLQIIFRLRRKCNFTESVRAPALLREVPRVRVTRCLINCAVPNLLRELTVIVYDEKSTAGDVVRKFNHRKMRSRKLIRNVRCSYVMQEYWGFPQERFNYYFIECCMVFFSFSFFNLTYLIFPFLRTEFLLKFNNLVRKAPLKTYIGKYSDMWIYLRRIFFNISYSRVVIYREVLIMQNDVQTIDR